MNAKITNEYYGRYAGDVTDFSGDLILVRGELEIHPGNDGGYCVVAPKTGEVLSRFAGVEEAVEFADGFQSMLRGR